MFEPVGRAKVCCEAQPLEAFENALGVVHSRHNLRIEIPEELEIGSNAPRIRLTMRKRDYDNFSSEGILESIRINERIRIMTPCEARLVHPKHI